MIRDARVLHPEFVPGDVVHRQHEINTLTAALEPLTNGNIAEPVFLYGPSGTGKTCIARYTVEKLRETVFDLEYQYVNCWEDYTRFKTLYRILDGLDKSFDIHRQSTPRDVLLDRLRDYDGPPYVVILDEVDQLEDKRILYELYRTSGVALILIANDETSVFADLNPRLSSRFQTSERIHFNRYSLSELVAILEDRAKWGLEPDTVSNSQLKTIADVAAGDARVAIGILRNAAKKASQQDLNEITGDVIQESVPETKSEIRQQNLGKLTDEQQVVYDIIAEADEIEPSDLYQEYRDRVEDPKTDRTVRNYLEKMERYNLIRTEGENRGRTYRCIT
jgi:orc1/cdc6 family replication initiation protein